MVFCILLCGRGCGGRVCPGQCPGGSGVPAGATLPHRAMGRRPEAAAPPHRAKHGGEFPASGPSVGVVCVLIGTGASAGTGVPTWSLPFQKVLLENIPVWELFVPTQKILTSGTKLSHIGSQTYVCIRIHLGSWLKFCSFRLRNSH